MKGTTETSASDYSRSAKSLRDELCRTVAKEAMAQDMQT